MSEATKNLPTKAKPSGNGKEQPAGDVKEPKDVKFKRLANRRVPNAVQRIRHVANLANRNQYTYTDEQAAKIIQMLTEEVAALKNRFSAVKVDAVDAKLF